MQGSHHRSPRRYGLCLEFVEPAAYIRDDTRCFVFALDQSSKMKPLTFMNQAILVSYSFGFFALLALLAFAIAFVMKWAWAIWLCLASAALAILVPALLILGFWPVRARTIAHRVK
jgi:hypothetical protein